MDEFSWHPSFRSSNLKWHLPSFWLTNTNLARLLRSILLTREPDIRGKQIRAVIFSQQAKMEQYVSQIYSLQKCKVWRMKSNRIRVTLEWQVQIGDELIFSFRKEPKMCSHNGDTVSRNASLWILIKSMSGHKIQLKYLKMDFFQESGTFSAWKHFQTAWHIWREKAESPKRHDQANCSSKFPSFTTLL